MYHQAQPAEQACRPANCSTKSPPQTPQISDRSRPSSVGPESAVSSPASRRSRQRTLSVAAAPASLRHLFSVFSVPTGERRYVVNLIRSPTVPLCCPVNVTP